MYTCIFVNQSDTHWMSHCHYQCHNLAITFLSAGELRGDDRWARLHSFHRLSLEILLQMLQHVEVSMLHHCHHALWHTTRHMLGMCLRLHCIHTHLGDHALSEVYGDPAGHLQEVFHNVLLRLPGAVLQRLRRVLQRLEKVESFHLSCSLSRCHDSFFGFFLCSSLCN